MQTRRVKNQFLGAFVMSLLTIPFGIFEDTEKLLRHFHVKNLYEIPLVHCLLPNEVIEMKCTIFDPNLNV